jgi:ABC-type uncharacterized transport system permease subunit
VEEADGIRIFQELRRIAFKFVIPFFFASTPPAFLTGLNLGLCNE